MIQGTFGSKGQLFFEIELLTHHGDSLVVDAIQEILLGSQWLKQFDLIAKYPENLLTLG